MGERYLDAVEAGGSKPPVPTRPCGTGRSQVLRLIRELGWLLVGLELQQEDKISVLKGNISILGIFPNWWGCLFLLRLPGRSAGFKHQE